MRFQPNQEKVVINAAPTVRTLIRSKKLPPTHDEKKL